VRGSVADGRRSLVRARAITGTAGAELHAAEFLALLLEHCAGRPVPPPGAPSAADSAPAGVLVRGIQLAAAGDTVRARELWRIALRRPDPYGFEGASDLLESWIGGRGDP